MWRYTIQLAAFLIVFSLNAQSDLNSILQEVRSLIQDVQVGKDEVFQTFDFREDSPYRVEIFLREVNSKGKEKLTTYQVNLALMDPNLLRWEDGRDQIKVNFRTGRDPVIKVLKEGKLSGYSKEAYLLAADIDNARKMRDVLLRALPLAKEEWEKITQLPESFTDLKNWVAEEVQDVFTDNSRIEQDWEDEGTKATRIALNTENDKGEKKVFKWNLADIHPPSIRVNIKAKTVKVDMHTSKRAKYVQVMKNGELDNYVDNISIVCAEADEALTLAYALRKLIPLAVEIEKEATPSYSDRQAAFDALTATLGDFKSNETSYQQQLEGPCDLSFTQTTETEKKRVEKKYRFSFSDLNDQGNSIVIRGKTVSLNSKTREKKNYLYLMEDGEQQNYANNLNWYIPDVPSAKLVQLQLRYLIDNCPAEVEAEDFAWLENRIESIKETVPNLNQSLELGEGSTCKWVFTATEEKPKKVVEEKYEINLYDLDPKKLDIAVKTTTVHVVLSTLGNDEIIKNYSNGEELGYVRSVKIRVKDVATAKIFVKSLENIINSCEK